MTLDKYVGKGRLKKKCIKCNNYYSKFFSTTNFCPRCRKYFYYLCPNCEWDHNDVTDLSSPPLKYYIQNKKPFPIKKSWIFNKLENCYVLNSDLFKFLREEFNIVDIYPKILDQGQIMEIYKCPRCEKVWMYKQDFS